jgi:hypothetical protein
MNLSHAQIVAPEPDGTSAGMASARWIVGLWGRATKWQRVVIAAIVVAAVALMIYLRW